MDNAVLDILKSWTNRYLSDYEAVVLLLFLIGGFAVVLTMGTMLAPVFAALVFAFILQGMVNGLERFLPHVISVYVVFCGFLAFLLTCILFLIPLVWEQSVALINEIPGMVRNIQDLLRNLPDMYPGILSDTHVKFITEAVNTQVTGFGQRALSASLSHLPIAMVLVVYLVLVPILVFFFLKDKKFFLEKVLGLLPKRRRLINAVAEEMNGQIANYIRGKTIEIVIVGICTSLAFMLLQLNYAVLLGVLVGLSVIVPYVGAAVVTVPVLVVTVFQFGFTDGFLVVMSVYAVIQALDANILVPILFSEAVNLHPVAIVLAILIFGGLWGVWGVFFAIPLATLLKAVCNSWPKNQDTIAENSVSEG